MPAAGLTALCAKDTVRRLASSGERAHAAGTCQTAGNSWQAWYDGGRCIDRGRMEVERRWVSRPQPPDQLQLSVGERRALRDRRHIRIGLAAN